MNDIFSLEGKVALVTGSSRGIGAGIARMFAKSGAAVAITGRTASEVEASAAAIREAGGRAAPFPVDIADASNLPALIEGIVSEFGGLDILVNNAGGSHPSHTFVDTRIEDLERDFHLLVSISFELARLALPHLLARPGASIVNILSPGAYKATRGNLSYYTAKSALSHMTKLMAADLGPRVRVNAIVPGAIETPALKDLFAERPEVEQIALNAARMRRLGQPDEIGYGAVYLASPAAAYVTGAILPIHGGEVEESRPISPDL